MRLGFDLGGTKLLAAAVSADGTLHETARLATGRCTPPAVAVEMMAALAGRLCEAMGSTPRQIGVGFPGVTDWARGVARSSVMLDGWHEYALRGALAERLGHPTTAVHIDNDANCAALAESAHRKQLGDLPRCMLFVSVGTGVGGAWVIDGQLWRGASGVAGELGHLPVKPAGDAPCRCGRRGCLGTVASGSAVAADPERAASALGEGLASAMNLFNPDLIVLGGGVAQRGAHWLSAVTQVARREALNEAARVCRIELASAGYVAGAVGAALLGRDT